MESVEKVPFVSVIMPNWNGKDDTLECLDSLRQLNYAKDRMEIIIVDNGSEDGSQEAIRNKYQEMRDDGYWRLLLLENGKNLGAPAAYNRGIRAANPDYDYILKIDNDVIFDEECLRELVKTAEEDEKIGIVGGKVYFFEDKTLIQSAGGKIGIWRGRIPTIGYKEKDVGQYDKLQEVDWVCGALMLLKRKVINKIGLLDDRYFVYYDETDWAIRAKRVGFKIIYVPHAKIWHKLSVAVKKVKDFGMYYMTRNRIIFQRKFCNNIQYIFFNLYFWCREFPVRMVKEFGKNWGMLKVFIRAVLDGYSIQI